LGGELARRRLARRRRRQSADFLTALIVMAVCVLGAVMTAHLTTPSVAIAQEGPPPAAVVAGTPVIGSDTDLVTDEFYVHIPATAVAPLQVVVVLHGMGGKGPEFTELARDRADQHNWVLVAPTFEYGNWLDPAVVTREAAAELPDIASFIDRLPAVIGKEIKPRIFLYGFSRGGQTANRFALVYPQRVAAVAICSSGTYTVPAFSIPNPDSSDGVDPLFFPYGVANLDSLFGQPFDGATFAHVPFWVGVGTEDRNPADVPHQWDRTLGSNRLERAQQFGQWLRAAGTPVDVQLFAGLSHVESETMRDDAFDFFAAQPDTGS
jgi:pimeloyl-ACP methyl ester carboxylesterase